MHLKKIQFKPEIGYFNKVFDYFNRNCPYEELFEKLLDIEREDISSLVNLFTDYEGQELNSLIYSLSKSQIEDVFSNIMRFMELVQEEKIISIIELRYRKYLFRMLYVLWQNNYENNKLRKIFSIAIDIPKTKNYVEEIGFSVEDLRRIVLSKNVEHTMIGLSRQESLSMKEFLTIHKINRKTILGIDSLSVFFLFCSAQDYLDFGSERLIVAISRYELVNQAKTFNNMLKKLDTGQRKELGNVIAFLLDKYQYNVESEEINLEFWGYISSESVEILKKEFL